MVLLIILILKPLYGGSLTTFLLFFINKNKSIALYKPRMENNYSQNITIYYQIWHHLSLYKIIKNIKYLNILSENKRKARCPSDLKKGAEDRLISDPLIKGSTLSILTPCWPA